MRLLLTACLLSGSLAAQTTQPSWRLKYFYDKDESSFQIRDLSFASERRGIAIGAEEVKGRLKPASLVTSDGGATWSLVATPEFGISLFFLNENVGWMVTEKGLLRTSEAGRNWQKMKAPKGLLRVYFQDENRGFGVGLEKGAWETRDGGKEWKKIEAADKPQTKAEHTAFGWVDFTGKVGVIAGWSRTPRISHDHVPDWMDPEQARRRREWPTSTILLQTNDGGETWLPSVSSMFGRLARMRRGPKLVGLALVRFDEQFSYPSEVFRLDPVTGDAARVYRNKEYSITDLVIAPSGRGYLAGCAKPGTVRQLPIPGKMVVLQSDNLRDFKPMEVDYRAECDSVVLALAGQGSVWAATDTGMLLKLE